MVAILQRERFVSGRRDADRQTRHEVSNTSKRERYDSS